MTVRRRAKPSPERLMGHLSGTVDTPLTEQVAVETRKREDKERRTQNAIDMAFAHNEEFGVIGAEHPPI